MKRPLLVALTVIAIAGCTSGGAAPASSEPPPPPRRRPRPHWPPTRAFARPTSLRRLRRRRRTPAQTSVPPIDRRSSPAPSSTCPTAIGRDRVTTDGKTVWASTNGAIVRIDTATNASRLLTAPTASGDTTLAIAADGLWATRWEGGKLYRLDPQTGAVQLSVAMPRAVRIAFVGSDLWVGREDVGKMFRVDRKTGAVGASRLPGGVRDRRDGRPLVRLRRVADDPPGRPVDGRDEGHDRCSRREQLRDRRSVPRQRLDGLLRPRDRAAVCGAHRPCEQLARGRRVPATLARRRQCGRPKRRDVGRGVITTIDDGTPLTALLRVDPDTGAIERSLSLPGVDADGPVVAGGALWIPDETGHRIVRVDATELSG